MLLLGLWLCVLTVVIVFNEIRAAKQNARIKMLEHERAAWQIAAEHWERIAEERYT